MLVAKCFLCVAVFIVMLKIGGAYPCGDPGFVRNSQRIFQRNKRLVQFVCSPNFEAFGNTLLSCMHGKWRGTKPVCTAPGCPTLEVLHNGFKTTEVIGGVVRFFCNSGYKLQGNQVLYCDGIRWNATRPICTSDVRRPMETRHPSQDQLIKKLLSNEVSTHASIYPTIKPFNKSSVVGTQSRFVLPLYANVGMETTSSSNSVTNVKNKPTRLLNNTYASISAIVNQQKPNQFAGPLFNQHPSNMTPLNSSFLSYDTARKLLLGLVQKGDQLQQNSTVLNGTHFFPLKNTHGDHSMNHSFQTSRPGPTQRLSSCPSPLRPRRGFHITRPLPPEYADDEYVYYIEYHCLPGLTMVSGDNTSYCLKNGKWSGQVPICEDVQGCVTGFKRTLAGTCEDINECDRHNGGCPQICQNSLGSYQCMCKYGFHLAQDSLSCIDVNECGHAVQLCSHICMNTFGSYQCTCRMGFFPLGPDGRTCLDVNECLPDGLGPCQHSCVNTYGSFKCLCNSGYKLERDAVSCSLICENGLITTREVGESFGSCIDIDECEDGAQNLCEVVCINTFGSYVCDCNDGFVLSKDGYTCFEIYPSYQSVISNAGVYVECNGNNLKECLQCPAHSSVQEVEGVYQCMCILGYKGNPKLSIECTEIDECNDSNYGCSHICVNTNGGVYCDCPHGFLLDTDGRTCRDVNECLISGKCINGICNNLNGSYSCSCLEGYTVDFDDPHTCVESLTSCDPLVYPLNGRIVPADLCGATKILKLGLTCHYFCNRGYHIVGKMRTKCTSRGWSSRKPECVATPTACENLENPENGLVLPARLCLGQQVHTAGRVCLYTCNRGYQIRGSGRRVCGMEGWTTGAPTCVATQLCPPVLRPNHAEVIPRSCYLQRSVRWQLCVFVCRSGYTLVGNLTTRCGSNQTWNTLPPKCIKESTDNPEVPFIECPPDIDIDLREGQSYANVTVVGPVSNMNIIERRSDGHGSRNSFPAGITIVEFTAYSDDRQLHSSCRVKVNVKDKEAPIIQQCPQSITIITSSQFPNVTWDEPLFSDNVQVVNIQMSRIPPGPLTWGTYRVTYTANDAAGNVAECTYAITLKSEPNCSDLQPHNHGKLSCTSWLKGRFCEISCIPGYELSSESPLTYLCTNGVWASTDTTPKCLETADHSHVDLYQLETSEVVVTLTTEISRQTTQILSSTSPTAIPISCMQGHVLSLSFEGGYKCKPCPAGTYRPELKFIKSCIPCPHGFYQNLMGQGFCHPCPTISGSSSDDENGIALQEEC